MEGSTVLVVGGAGYIGSHMIKRLLATRCHVVTLDNFRTGHRDAVLGGDIVEGDLADKGLLGELFRARRFDVVMHFASFIQVSESMHEPSRYYGNNVANTLNLLDAMVQHGMNRFIFSSSAAVYGEPDYLPIDEQHPLRPTNPYGRTKWMVEQILDDYNRAYGLKSVRLRYFNAAGADPEGKLGERHKPETHLIPLVLQVASGRQPHIVVFGRDYDTPDGTCIRDYIHVTDLCEAHLLAAERLMSGCDSAAYNLGNGKGFSVQEIIDAARAVTGRNIPVVDSARREGDPARLVADSARAMNELGWRPGLADMGTILEHAWNWERKTIS